MARRETRSPSPTGSSYSARRSRDDRYPRDRKDDSRGYRSRRSRSRSLDVSHAVPLFAYEETTAQLTTPQRRNDRDGRRRRDRSVDRRDDRRNEDIYRPSRRDRSRERRRTRSPGRDRKNRSRERDHRERRDGDRYGRPHDDSTELRRPGDRPSNTKAAEVRPGSVNTLLWAQGLTKQLPNTPTSNKSSEEDKKKAERLAKLEAWKAKQAAERERKLKEAENAAGGGVRNVLDEMDKMSAGSPAVASPLSPTVANGNASPAPYSGKFDPKAIAKKGAGVSEGKSALGMVIPEGKGALGMNVSAPTSTLVTTSIPHTLPNKGTYVSDCEVGVNVLTVTSALGKLRPLNVTGNINGFGISKAEPGTTRTGAKRALDDGDMESTRKLQKLPTQEELGPPDVTEIEMDESPDTPSDTEMRGTETRTEIVTAAPKEEEVEEDADDLDPLDAFMSGLKDSGAGPTIRRSGAKGEDKQRNAPLVMSGDEEGDMDVLDNNPEDILAVANKRKKKDIPAIDHSKITYLPFRKAFFSIPSELAGLSKDDVADLRLELGIKVVGNDTIPPVQNFPSFGLNMKTLDTIKQLNYLAPTPIQAQAIPIIMSGRDVMGISSTGSGKTQSFAVPGFRVILDQPPSDGPISSPIVLIMAPTRELASQIFQASKPFLKALQLKGVAVVGGNPISEDINILKRGGISFLVATPGRLIDLLSSNNGRVLNLFRTCYLVLDEADRLLDLGFEAQVRKVNAQIRKDAQRCMFSATFNAKMEKLAKELLDKPVEIIAGGRSVVSPDITQIVQIIPKTDKFHRLLEVLGRLYDVEDDTKTLIFVERQESADTLLHELMKKGYFCDSVHGGRDQVDRTNAIDEFRRGIVPILIATSVAGRGLDVPMVAYVINYDAPHYLEDYVHRIGRTGRAGNKGTAITMLEPEEERYAVHLARALKESSHEVPEELQKMADTFHEKVKSGEEVASGSGFGGKGLDRYAQQRDAERTRERKTYKVGDEGEEEEQKEEKTEVEDAILVQATGAPAASAVVPKGFDLDQKIVVHKTEAPAANAATDPLAKVRAAVQNIDDRLTKKGQLRPGQPVDNKGPDAGEFHATLSVNQYSQKARWSVTNRTNIARVLEAYGVSITSKGNYYPPGKEPGPGEPAPLYLLVEGSSEIAVTNAMQELVRLLKEALANSAEADARAPASGRYTVV